MKTKMERVTAGNVKAVVDHCGGNIVLASHRMGLYPSTVGRAIRTNECTTRIDLLARGALDQLAREWNEYKTEVVVKPDPEVQIIVENYHNEAQVYPVLYGVMVTAEKQKSFQKLMTLMGLEAVEI